MEEAVAVLKKEVCAQRHYTNRMRTRKRELCKIVPPKRGVTNFGGNAKTDGNVYILYFCPSVA